MGGVSVVGMEIMQARENRDSYSEPSGKPSGKPSVKPSGKPSGKAVGQSFALISALTFFATWGFEWIPIWKLPVSQFWWGIIYRSVIAVTWLLLMWALKPRMFKRLFVVRDPMRLLGGFGVVVFLILPQLFHTPFRGHTPWQILEGFFFALFIGIDEELFSRGLIFGFLDKYGIKVAAVLSSIHFGALHLGNAIWGGQSFSYTAGQVLDAAAFGYLACGLMLFSGTIWMSILLHGLSDFPMQMVSRTQFTHEVTGGFNWIGTLIDFAIYVVIGSMLMRAAKGKSLVSPS